MNKNFFSIICTILITGAIVLGCKSSNKEVIESQEKVEEAQENLVEAKKEASAEEWKAFKKQTDSVIEKNEIRITELKLKIKNSGKTVDANFEKNINILEQKNKDLKVKMEGYKNDISNDWQSFKREFSHDMNEIGEALKNVTVDNED